MPRTFVNLLAKSMHQSMFTRHCGDTSGTGRPQGRGDGAEWYFRCSRGLLLKEEEQSEYLAPPSVGNGDIKAIFLGHVTMKVDK